MAAPDLSIPVRGSGAAKAVPGRPLEIEEWSNQRLIHPLSRKLVTLLIPTGISPNMVSVSGVFAAAAAAACYALLPWPRAAFAGFACQLVWHVLDGADGDLARRTGRASTNGEIVDGVCDHASQLVLYSTFAFLLSLQIGLAAWLLALTAALSHFVQANAYETLRRKYGRWGYGATSLREELASRPARGGLGARLGSLYVALSRRIQVPEQDLAFAMERAAARGPEAETAARALYREQHRGLVKSASLLSSNQRTLAAFLSMLLGSPLYFFLFEITVLNCALIWFSLRETVRSRLFVSTLLKESSSA